MSESLEAWYQAELDYFRHSASDFAERFPKIADRLSLSGSDIRDPHVERLIQAFAYLNARTRRKLDDSFPELADAMLGILYPHMLAPVPSVSVLR
ncbi:MAG: type VI secretion system baseplate subunit TssF, partial [Fuerstiella sp.]